MAVTSSSSENIKEKCHPFQLIDEDGKFNGDKLDDFVEKVKLNESGVSYVVAAIVGPQSSGKSTLLNHLFGTDFKVMNAATGKKRATQGIWMANCPGINPHTLIMDVEGNDGQERGEDDTNFERQSALFTLILSNIVIVNMSYSDVGREQGANKPLLRTVFQAMVTMFRTNKVTLMFVIRDVDPETQFLFLEAQVKKSIQEIWESINPQNAQLGEFFNVQVVTLPHLKHQKDQFAEEVSNLRKRFFDSISPGGIASGKESLIPSSGFSYSAMKLWKIIRENKELDLPSHKVLVATVFCEKIADENFTWFSEKEGWLDIKKSVRDGDDIKGFGVNVNSLLDTCLNEYQERTKYYDDKVQEAKRKALTERISQLIQPEWNLVVDSIGSRAFKMFNDEFNKALQNGEDPSKAARVCTDSLNTRFDEGCADAAIQLAKWDISIVKAKLFDHMIDNYVNIQMTQHEYKHAAKLAETRAAAAKSAEDKAIELQQKHEKELAAIQERARVAAINHERVRKEEYERNLAAIREANRKAASDFFNHKKKKYNWNKERDSFLVNATDLSIAWGDNSSYWRWPYHRDTSAVSEGSIMVAELIKVCWLDVNGTFEVEMLGPYVTYQIYFVVMLKVPHEKWNFPVSFHLTLPDGTIQQRKRNISQTSPPGEQWFEILVGGFKRGPSQQPSGIIKFSMLELEGHWKTGLVIKGVAIRPFRGDSPCTTM